ncbi:MAG: response regulator transcription factor [Chloroflexales bacterium]|nr:response regulator transcription factor [Chloroflexales bacterium]
MSKSIRLMIIDDHSIIRHGLRSILELEPDIQVVGEANDGEAALRLLGELNPDIVLLDLSLGRHGTAAGLELCQTITSAHPDTGVIVLTTFLEERLVVQAIRNGAKGYVLKDVDAVDLSKLIRAVYRGESALDTRSAAFVMKSFLSGGSSPQVLLELTEREMAVIQLLGQGYSNKEIGEQIAISESTVKFHVRKIMRKLNVHHRTEVVYTAGKLGLI